MVWGSFIPIEECQELQ